MADPNFDIGGGQIGNNLGLLARGLFPDPVRGAQGYYYGTEGRKNILSSEEQASHEAAAATALMQALRLGNPSMPTPDVPTYRPSALPGGAPIMNPPSNLPMAQATPGQIPPQGPPLPTPPGYPGPNGPSATGLASIFAPGSPANPKGLLTTGTPPPASSPAPNAGAPPAPNTTTSNGQPPPDNQGDGPIHPGLITSSDGGQKYAGPAGPNGSPARLEFNPLAYVALQTAAGRDANTAKLQLLAYYTDGYRNGIIDKNSFEQLTAALGNPMYESDQATTRVGMEQAGQTARQNIVTGEKANEFQRTPFTVQGRDAQNNPTILLPGAPGQPPVQAGPAFNEPLQQQNRGLVQVAGPQGQPLYQRQGDVQPGTPAFNEQLTQQQRALDNLIVKVDQPDGRGAQITFADYRALPPDKRPPLTKESMEAVQAGTVTAALGGSGTGPAATARGAITAATPVKPRTEEEDKLFNQNIDATVQRRFAPDKDTAWYNFARDNASLADDDTRAAIDARASDILRQNRTLNPSEAINQSISELTQTGHIPDPKTLNTERGWQSLLATNPRIKTQQTKGGAVGVFRVPLLKSYEPGAVAVAPKGANDGDIVGKGNQTGVVRNGFIYPR